jgi:hypothetical protein
MYSIVHLSKNIRLSAFKSLYSIHPAHYSIFIPRGQFSTP